MNCNKDKKKSTHDCQYQHHEIESPNFFFLFWVFFFRQNYYTSLEFFFDVLTLFNVKITVKTKYQMSIDYSTSFWVNYSEHTFLKHDK